MAGPTNYHRTTLSMINQFYLRKEHWDVKLIVGGRFFRCHRVLLAATSMYFDTLFKSGNFIEADPTPAKVIILRELTDATAFEEILHFVYTGEIRVDASNALHLLSQSKFLRLRTDNLQKACLQYLKSRFLETIHTPKAIDLYCSAMSMGQRRVVDYVSAYIFEHMYHFLMDPKLMEISLENLEALLVYGGYYIALAPGSSAVLLAIIHNWINFNREERRQYRSKLMDSIHSWGISSDFTFPFIMRLEEAVDEARLSKDVQSISELKALEMGIDIGDIGGNARLSETISFNVKNVSKLKHDQVEFSPSCVVSNLSLKTCIQRKKDNIVVALMCDGADAISEWSCRARAIFTIKSLTEGLRDFVGNSGLVQLSSKKPDENCLDCLHELQFHDLINPEKGFIMDDDSITIHTLVYTGVLSRSA